MKLRFFEDAGHGWLEVPLSLIRSLGIADKISHYSYLKGEMAYLEEDCDAGLFIRALGSEPAIERIYHHDSPVRNYRSYKGETP